MSKYLQTSRHRRKTFVRGRRVARADADQVTSGKVSDSFVSRDRARWLAAENNNRLKCFSPTLSQVYFRRKGKRGRNKRCWATRATRCAAGVAKRQQEVDIVWDAKGDWRHACVSPHWRARGERESGRSKGDLFDPDTYWRHRGVELFKLISNESRTLPSLGNKVFFLLLLLFHFLANIEISSCSSCACVSFSPFSLCSLTFPMYIKYTLVVYNSSWRLIRLPTEKRGPSAIRDDVSTE